MVYDAYEEATDTSSDDAVESAKTMYDWWVGYYQSQKGKYEEGKIGQTEHDYAMAAMIEAEETWERARVVKIWSFRRFVIIEFMPLLFRCALQAFAIFVC